MGRASALAALMALGAIGQELKPSQTSPGQPAWDPKQAARYMDGRMDLWFAKAAKLRTGEGRTSCISCHSVVPYLLARPALRKATKVNDLAPQETRLLAEIAQRVDTWDNNEPLYARQEKQSRGTELVLDALVLAWADASQGRKEPSQPVQKALRHLWETQCPDGAWDWLDLGSEPDESRDSRYYGAAMAAIALGTAPGLAQGLQAESAGSASSHLGKLRLYLNGNYAGQNLYNRAWMLLASTRLEGLLNPEQRGRLMAELQGSQNSDGGWSLYKLGPWRWSRTDPPFAPGGSPNLSLLAKSDGYATGLVAFALRQAGLPASGPALRKARDWLASNQEEVQIEQQRWKCWRAHSLNQDREHGGNRGGPWNRMIMSDMATAFAALALVPATATAKANDE